MPTFQRCLPPSSGTLLQAPLKRRKLCTKNTAQQSKRHLPLILKHYMDNFVVQNVTLISYLPMSYQLQNLCNYHSAEGVRVPTTGWGFPLPFRTEINQWRAALTLQINLNIIQQFGCTVLLIQLTVYSNISQERNPDDTEICANKKFHVPRIYNNKRCKKMKAENTDL
jgi:hypothetical protein